MLEIGFGLGLNCLITADAAVQYGSRLDYHAFEHSPITADTLQDLEYAQWLSDPTLTLGLAQALTQLQQYTDGHAANATAASPTKVSTRLAEAVQLTLYATDAHTWRFPAHTPPFDVIYLDAFSPAVNPECWTQDMLARCFAWLRPGGVLATYCVQGAVRRSLEAVGFHCVKHPGPPGKRETLTAHR